jgi:uncharacterized protein YbcC (UPF0753/DUF2309 family)
MDEYESLSHTRWDCKYHVVFIPKCRRKALRLNVFIEASEGAMEAVIEKNASVRALVDNGWLFLHAIGDDGKRIRRRLAAGEWRDCAPDPRHGESRAG